MTLLPVYDFHHPIVRIILPRFFLLLRAVSTFLMVCFLFVTLVIMLNILIAQLSDTYQNVQADAQRGLEVNRAWNVARVELNSWFHGQVDNTLLRSVGHASLIMKMMDYY